MPTQIVIPEIADSVHSGVIAAWLKDEGDHVDRDEPILELETDKITLEIPAPAAGTVSHQASVGDEVDVGAVVGTIDESANGAAPAKKAEPAKAESKPEPVAAAPTSAPAAGGAPDADVRATPLARKLAEEKGVDLHTVSGTGAGGRIREQDVLAAAEAPAAPAPKPTPAAPSGPAPAAATVAGERGVRHEKMSPLRQRIASRLVEAQQTAAMLTTFNECDMTEVMRLRKLYKERFQERHGIGLGFMSFFVKACVQGLARFPAVNASIVEHAGSPSIEYHDYCDIAMAVSTPKGLAVPVLRNCENLSLAGIEQGVKDLAVRARDGKLGLDDMAGGTFTITNGGIFGSLMSTPILNPPQTGILGMHTIKKRAVEDPENPGQLALRPMMYLALSYDHRVIDGAQAVQFLVVVKEAIENPERLLLDI